MRALLPAAAAPVTSTLSRLRSFCAPLVVRGFCSVWMPQLSCVFLFFSSEPWCSYSWRPFVRRFSSLRALFYDHYFACSFVRAALGSFLHLESYVPLSSFPAPLLSPIDVSLILVACSPVFSRRGFSATRYILLKLCDVVLSLFLDSLLSRLVVLSLLCFHCALCSSGLIPLFPRFSSLVVFQRAAFLFCCAVACGSFLPFLLRAGSPCVLASRFCFLSPGFFALRTR